MSEAERAYDRVRTIQREPETNKPSTSQANAGNNSCFTVYTLL
jgi:hypothetical protein